MVTHRFEQCDKDDHRLEVYINAAGLIFMRITDEDDDYYGKYTTLDLSDARDLYQKLGELIKEMSNG